MFKTRAISWLLLAFAMLSVPAASFGQISVGVSIRIGPPALPVYAQPICPGPGYIWTPGYWAYGPTGYYWVPGTWVVAPRPGLLWTPGYWGWANGLYAWHAGYWGPHVGFYGGINYGFGYGGVGFAGGYWNHGVFMYNRSVTNINVAVIHNTYNRAVVNNVTVNHVAFNGGPGGIAARPTREDEIAAHEQHFQPTGLQAQHEQAASRNRAFLASVNHGRPAMAATARPGEFNGHSGMAAHENGPANHEARPESHPVNRENNAQRQGSENHKQPQGKPQQHEKPQHENEHHAENDKRQ